MLLLAPGGFLRSRDAGKFSIERGRCGAVGVRAWACDCLSLALASVGGRED